MNTRATLTRDNSVQLTRATIITVTISYSDISHYLFQCMVSVEPQNLNGHHCIPISDSIVLNKQAVSLSLLRVSSYSATNDDYPGNHCKKMSKNWRHIRQQQTVSISWKRMINCQKKCCIAESSLWRKH